MFIEIGLRFAATDKSIAWPQYYIPTETRVKSELESAGVNAPRKQKARELADMRRPNHVRYQKRNGTSILGLGILPASLTLFVFNNFFALLP